MVKRYLILTAAVLMQLCLGALYSWSVYVSPLREITGLSQGVTQLPFSIFYFTFPAITVVSGTWLLPKLGTRISAVLGGLLFGSGWLLAGLGKFSFFFPILGIGILAGIGAGMAYLVPVSVGMSWFPKNKGLVTGVAVAGFGGGAALISFAGSSLMGRLGLSPFQVFSILGTAFLLLIPTSGTFMVYPPGMQRSKMASLNVQDLLKERIFQYLYLAMLIGLAAGFSFNANIREIYAGMSASAGLLAVSLFALANGAGRIIWGWIADHWESENSIATNLALQSLVMAGVIFLHESTLGFMLLSTMAGFNYGGVLVLYAAVVEKVWGADRLPGIYGWLFSSNIPAATAPVLAGLSFDQTGSFSYPFFILAGLGLSAAILIKISISFSQR
jgi:OFA family oxalate/formate antiporter-like MFS transporter